MVQRRSRHRIGRIRPNRVLFGFFAFPSSRLAWRRRRRDSSLFPHLGIGIGFEGRSQAQIYLPGLQWRYTGLYTDERIFRPAAYPPVRTEETLEVRCWRCFTNQELPARNARFQCRICGSRLRIELEPGDVTFFAP